MPASDERNNSNEVFYFILFQVFVFITACAAANAGYIGSYAGYNQLGGGYADEGHGHGDYYVSNSNSTNPHQRSAFALQLKHLHA